MLLNQYCTSLLALIAVTGCIPPLLPNAGNPVADCFSRLEGGGLYSGGIAYSVDSDCLIVSSPVSGRGDLWWIGCDGKWASVISETAESEIDPCLSNDEQEIYFARFVDGRYRIVSRNLRTQTETVVVDIRDQATNPVPLPDGNSLLFVRNGLGAPASSSEIWEISLQTRELRRLTTNTVYDGSISCFRDSQRILFCQDASKVFIMDLKTKACQFVCEGAKPVLSDDDKTVFVSRQRKPSYNYDIWKHDLATGQERQFPCDGSIIADACRLPEGKIAIICDVPRDRVGRLSILEPTTGEWSFLPRLLGVRELQ